MTPSTDEAGPTFELDDARFVRANEPQDDSRSCASPIASFLVACDLSGTTREVLGFAAALAAPVGARLVLMHVIVQRRCPALLRLRKWARSQRFETLPRTDPIGRLRKRRHLELIRLVKEAGLESPNVERAVTIGKPYVEILAMADQVKADVIFLGTGKAGQKMGNRLGSTAGRVLKHSMLPVVTIRLH